MKTTTYSTDYKMFIETLQDLEKSRKNIKIELETRKQDTNIFVRITGNEDDLHKFISENDLDKCISEIKDV